MIKALFRVPGSHRDRGGPILGFLGSEGLKIWNFQTGPFWTVRSTLLDLKSQFFGHSEPVIESLGFEKVA